MIHILPYLEHTIRTTKSPQEIHDIMQSVTSPKGEWYSSRTGGFIAWGQIISRYGFYFQAKKDIERLEELLNGVTPAAF